MTFFLSTYADGNTGDRYTTESSANEDQEKERTDNERCGGSRRFQQ